MSGHADMSDICHQPSVSKNGFGELRDEFGVFALAEILEIVEVVHKRFVFKELALGKNYSSDNRGHGIQFRYCGLARDCRNSKSVSNRSKSLGSAMLQVTHWPRPAAYRKERSP
jgi:hypothetical protein